MCHALDMTLSEEQLAGTCLENLVGEPSGIGSPGGCLLVLGPWLALVAEHERKAGCDGDVDRVPRDCGGSPRALG